MKCVIQPFAVILFIWFGFSSSALAETGSKTDAAFGMLPADAHAAVLAPDLKRLNDRLTELLQRMERPELLLPGRPIDAIRGWVGLGASLDENGPAVAFVRFAGDEPVATIVVQAIDPSDFLKGNFKKVEGANPLAYETLDGKTVFVRAQGNQIAISAESRGVEGIQPDSEGAKRLRGRLGEAGSAYLSKGDVLIWLDGMAARRAAEYSVFNVPMAIGQMIEPERLEGLNDLLVAVDFDPLGLMIHSWAGFKSESELGRLTTGGEPAAGDAGLSLVPANPYYAGISVDVAGLGGPDALRQFLPGIDLPAWIDDAKAFQFAVYPSSLGVAIGGLLNDSAMVVLSPEPKRLGEVFKNHVLGLHERDGIRLEGTWETDRAFKSGLVADAFEVKETVEAPPADRAAAIQQEQLFRRIVFGQRGFCGLVRTTAKSLVVTFSQRPDVMNRALESANGGGGLAKTSVIKAMRNYLLVNPDVEAYVSLGQLVMLARQVAGLLPGAAANIPDVRPNLEPIGAALQVQNSTVEGALVIPSGVLAVFAEQAMKANTPVGAPAAKSP